MNIKLAIRKFEKDPTHFLRHYPKLHGPLLKIVKERDPDIWIEGMPMWIVPEELMKDAIAVAPFGLLFMSNKVNKKDWIKIANHEKKESELVDKGLAPEEAHRLAELDFKNKCYKSTLRFDLSKGKLCL